MGFSDVNVGLFTLINAPSWWGVLTTLEGGFASVSAEDKWEISVPSQCCSELKMALKNKTSLLKSHTGLKDTPAPIIWRIQYQCQEILFLTIDPATHLKPGVCIVRLIHTVASPFTFTHVHPTSHTIILFAISKACLGFCFRFTLLLPLRKVPFEVLIPTSLKWEKTCWFTQEKK